jgi:hypothetical protein
MFCKRHTPKTETLEVKEEVEDEVEVDVEKEEEVEHVGVEDVEVKVETVGVEDEVEVGVEDEVEVEVEDEVEVEVENEEEVDVEDVEVKVETVGVENEVEVEQKEEIVNLVVEEEKQKLPDYIPTTPYLEYDSDVDAEIDRDDLTEVYDIHKDWGCQYWNKTENYFCEEKTVINNQFCSRHKSNFGKIPYKMNLHTYPLLEVNTVYCKRHDFTGQYWYPNLLLTAKPTSEGLVVIGRLLGQRWFQKLGRREIKRCHNNGLLYKVLSQKIVHKNYHIPPIETLEGEGFTSFDEMRFSRPTLYIKYWKIWNMHIQVRRQFIEMGSKIKDYNKWLKEHTCPLPDWSQIISEYHHRGLENVIIPPPSLEEVSSVDFNAWEYCENWVEENCPDKKSRPHFPPMYIDYPEPEVMRFRPYPQTYLKEKEMDLTIPERSKHYRRDPDEWIEVLTVKGRQWMKMYF